jgi:hypothetical protein
MGFRYWASRAFVYTNAQNLRFTAMPETAGFVGKHPKPFEQRFTLAAALRAWRIFEKMPFPFTGQYAIMLVNQPRRFLKISAGGGSEKRRNGA